MAYSDRHPKDLLMGAALGGIVGAVSALLIAPKSGEQLRHDIYDTYSDLSEKTHELAEDVTHKTKEIAENVSSQTSSLTETLYDLIDHAREWLSPSHDSDHRDNRTNNIIVGIVAGTILGGITGLVLAPKSGAALRKDLAHTYADTVDRTRETAEQVVKRGKGMTRGIRAQSNVWLDTAKDIVNYLSEERQNKSKIEDIAELASLGLRLWQSTARR